MEEIIEFKNIKKAYGEKVVMENFNLTIKKGEFITIIGSSGGGKTTIMKMVNGLITPTFGDVFVEGKNIKELNQNELRRNIGYAIQGSVLFPHMTVENNITYGLKVHKMDPKEINAQLKASPTSPFGR